MTWALTITMLLSIGFFSIPMVDRAWSDEGAGLPPVEQPIVREGDLAMSLARTLEVGRAQSEAEAESDLALLGISPPDGWTADYPVTPDTVEALQRAIADAAEADGLSMDTDEALERFDVLLASLGLPIRPDEDAAYPQEGPAAAYPAYAPYTEPSDISGYYYSQGPPLVTYFTPPWNYYFNYRWVPYPFWWNQYRFSGFFVLDDFHTYHKVGDKGHRHRYVTRKPVTSHYFGRKGNPYGREDPHDRLRGQGSSRYHDHFAESGFRNSAARRNADWARNRQVERTRPFQGREAEWRNRSSPGFRYDGVRGRTWQHRYDAMGRIDRQPAPRVSNGRGNRSWGTGLHRGTGQRFENPSTRFERNAGTASFGGMKFQNRAFVPPGSTGARTFSRGGGDGRGFSRGSGSTGRGFSGSLGSGRGGGGCRGRC